MVANFNAKLDTFALLGPRIKKERLILKLVTHAQEVLTAHLVQLLLQDVQLVNTTHKLERQVS